jgi:sporulation protein YlmC with PRC-barrel domain
MKFLALLAFGASVLAPTGLVSAQGQTDQQQQQQQQSQQSQGTQVKSKSLVGSTVRGQDGKDVGKVSDVMIDPAQGRISSVIISMGGTAGIGARELTVPWNAIQVGRDQQNIVVTLQQDALQQAPPRADDKKKDQSGGQASPSGERK